ncbi:MAG TPA: SGNH/GDSL hydrolase family protein [Nocardioidaceae bacterium]|nr:SGNH/GDSL hydrolase family protein [Nocardioidaceae bacterium]
MSLRFRMVALTAITLIVSLLGTPNAHAAVSYVALGDSYASGVGTRTYYSDSGSCYRSPYAYAVVDAARIGATLSFQACSGAKTGDVKNNQLGTLSTGTAYVTVQVGGNDAGFSDVITECAQPGWMSNCNGAIDTAQGKIRNTLPASLDSLYALIRSKAPNAKVVVVGYPRIFNGEDCNAGTWFSPSEESRLNGTADLLNSTISGRAAAKGFSFVNPTTAFVGHAVCDDVEWVNGLSNPIRESYHPNRSGQTGYANLVDDHLTS